MNVYRQMNKALCFLAAMLFTMAVNAQLKVESSGKVGIMTTLTGLKPKLTVGNSSFATEANASIGIAATPDAQNMVNIGVIGSVSANSNYTQDKNYGILGIVTSVNLTHGKNYGIGGMLQLSGSQCGGAGVYGTNSTYYLSSPTNIQGSYAGYFDGPVNVASNLTAPAMYTTMDSRLGDGQVSLSDRDDNGKETLENVLSMKVVEYNLKSRLPDEMPTGIVCEDTEAARKEYEALRADDQRMASVRHFGVEAEELQKLYPDLVLEGQDGYLSVNYSELVPILIRSIQTLKRELDEMKANREHTRKAAQTSAIQPSTSNDRNLLYKNTPNPFKESTVIRFHLAEGVKDAAICIFDMSGKMLKKMPVSSGMESVSLSGGEFQEGMFLYSLIVNGQEIDTRRMVLSR